jgi:methyltransferase (TIGR00027 family)
VEGVGVTAKMTAAARARESERADRLFEDPWAASLAGDEGFDFLAREEALLPDRPEAVFVLRHRFFDDFLLRRAGDGVRQVVLIAAGLDTRAFRLAWPSGVRVFELDQASVLDYKEAVLEKAGATAGCERKTVAVDLREDWGAALLEAGYDSTAAGVWLAEGLLFYLPEAAVYDLLDTTAKLSCAGSALGTDTMSSAMLASESRQTWKQFYADSDAPLKFGADRPADLLAEHGWQPTLHSYSELAEQLGRSWPSQADQWPRGAIISATLAV